MTLAGTTGAGLFRGGLLAWLRCLPARPRASLQMRVVMATLIISAFMLAAVGFLLTQQIAAGFLNATERAGQQLVIEGQVQAESRPGISSPPGSSSQTLTDDLIKQLEPQPGSASQYGVALLVAPRLSGPPVLYGGWTAGFRPPVELVHQVNSDQRHGVTAPSYMVTRLAYNGGPLISGIAYGVPLGSYYQLYYFFPLTQEQQSLALVQRMIFLGGSALAVLLAAIAWLVSRWVVVPIGQAVGAARRLSEGKLDERMPVRGSDVLSALARAFNEMAASLQEKMTELEGLSRVQRQFVSDVSHELRTPLTTIKIAADLLYATRDGLNPTACRSAELLQGQLERFEGLLADLLEISRYDANVATLDAEPADMCALVRNSAHVAQQLAERKGAKIKFWLPAGPCIAEVDRRRVERILRNLLVNAVEHGEGLDVVVTVAADPTAVAVAVRDFGVGLAPGEERMVFDRFWRADPARARASGGTGLGLSIALEDARLHGGWLEAWGDPGRGSVFRLTLPRSAGTELAGSPLPLGPPDAEMITHAPG
jgi:two-component system, OmpR family, sensor histidine kinase MtrB